MKKIISVILLLFICLCSWAQIEEEFSRSYNNFLKLNSAGVAESELYGALYECYQDAFDAIRNLDSNDSRYFQVKDILVDIWPNLRNAATYYDKKGNRKMALKFSQAYVDISSSREFQNAGLGKDEFYPTMVFYAASNTFNSADYRLAIKYFKEYESTGEQKHLYNVLKYKAVAYVNLKDYDNAKRSISEAISMNDSDYELLTLAINICIETLDNKQLQPYVSRALAIKPKDQNLLNIQGKLYEDKGNYLDALNIYNSLFAEHPSSLTYAKHVALNNYNLGVLFTNKSSLERDKRISSQYENRATMYFETAISQLKDVLNADPTLLQYQEALAVAYQMTGRENELMAQNRKISNLGGRVLSAESVPSLISYTTPAMKPENHESTVVLDQGSTPLYSQYAKKFVEESIEKWQTKDPYETIDEYKSRVTVKTRDEKIKSLLREAESSYISHYAREVRISDFKLCPYDAEHQVFLAESDYGDVLIPVPRANNEARIFESSWSGIQCMNPQYVIDNDRIVLSALTFVTPMGNSYRFDGSGTMDYTQTEVDIQFADIDYSSYDNNRYDNRVKSSVRKERVTIGTSDVDRNIPESKTVNDRTFAVIIANEDYEMVSSVPMALNDGRIFSMYCEKTLGLPKNNVRLYENATYGTMLHAITDIQSIASAYNGDINVIFYYAGHGFPDESTKDAFLLPVDGDGIHTGASYSLDRLYSELNDLKARRVCVFLDACFSGSDRGGSMLASARAVALKTNKAVPQGNMVVFSAASGDETAYPYEEKGHGLFTYYLLKILQDSKGNASLQEISDYVIDNVRKQSIVVNRKSQTPHVMPSSTLMSSWQDLRLKP